MPPGKNRLDHEEPIVEKRQKKTHEHDHLKDPDADIVDEEGEDE